MTITQWKKLAVVITFPALLAVMTLLSAPAQMATQDQPFDAAAVFKVKCAMCHGQTAEKKFNSTLPEEQMVEAILKGKKAEKPPNMPAYEEKGITADQAKALAAHMKSLKP